uniref:Uncharacterized protein n=1 Tax=Cacopsylla melanoneura TaxID=428564 RepID=A0A8D8WGN9_9HEMI
MVDSLREPRIPEEFSRVQSYFFKMSIGMMDRGLNIEFLRNSADGQTWFSIGSLSSKLCLNRKLASRYDLFFNEQNLEYQPLCLPPDHVSCSLSAWDSEGEGEG